MHEDYTRCTDEELLIRLRDGESGITDHIMNKYKNLVRSKAKSMYILGADSEDLIQEGMIGLFKAIRDYRTDKDTSFYHFAELCVTRQMYTAVEASRRKKHTPLNTYVPLDAGGEGQDDILLSIGQPGTLDPETLFISQENVRQLLKQVNERLSRMERQVLALYLEGMNYHQIADYMGKSPKSIDNALQRIRSKIR